MGREVGDGDAGAEHRGEDGAHARANIEAAGGDAGAALGEARAFEAQSSKDALDRYALTERTKCLGAGEVARALGAVEVHERFEAGVERRGRNGGLGRSLDQAGLEAHHVVGGETGGLDLRGGGLLPDVLTDLRRDEEQVAVLAHLTVMRDQRAEAAEQHLVRLAEGHRARDRRPNDTLEELRGLRALHRQQHRLGQAVTHLDAVLEAHGRLDLLAQAHLRARAGDHEPAGLVDVHERGDVEDRAVIATRDGARDRAGGEAASVRRQHACEYLGGAVAGDVEPPEV